MVVVSAKVPLESGTSPSGTVPLRIVTVPIAFAGTVPESVTASPGADGLRDDTRVTAGTALFTICENGADVLPAYAASPVYCAVSVCVPAVSDDTAIAAWPPESATGGASAT